MENHDFIKYVLLFGLSGIMLAVLVLFLSSITYYFVTHNKGVLQYIIKTISIGLITIPVAIILIVALVRYVVWQKGILTVWRFISPTAKITTVNDVANTGSEEVIVHLIHGTFEPNASWTQSESEMCKSIKSSNPNVGISRFVWDGKNSASSRKQAACQLGMHIEKSPAKYNYIIAHSHGAAIVREMSYLRCDIARKVQGVCLLSPPFIFRRRIKRTSGTLINLIDISGSLAIQFLLAVFLVPFDLYSFDYAALVFFVSIFFEIVISKKYKKEFLKEVESGEHRESVNFRNVEIYHAIGDEADSGLRFVSSLHEGCFAILSQLKKAQVSHGKLTHWSAVLSYLFYINMSMLIWFFYPEEKSWIFVFLVSFVLTSISHIWQRFKPSKDIPHVLLIAAIPVAIFSFWLAVAKAIAYGDLRLIFCPEVFISSSETPAGEHEIIKFAPQSDGMLIHSTHSHSEAIINVTEWLGCRENERVNGKP
ncbi:hypothetical protein [Pectobacterium versatile]|uniref:hypothetical protein n=1 Tax=Pectobacterium versatile TaxID=2488639 RepID=UPI000DAB363B|nr:hypothetical protein [Pectobacterium versatile]GBO51452.1 hypothetical protein MFFDBJGM_04501 [Pectobacterium versatile]